MRKARPGASTELRALSEHAAFPAGSHVHQSWSSLSLFAQEYLFKDF